MAFITIEGQNKIALQQGNAELLAISHFVLANISGLGAEPADRIETMPSAGNIVDTRPVTKSGYVNANQVVYSLTLDSTIGDYTFNWVGLKDADGVLIAAIYLTDPITKTASSGGVDGNNLVRNFLLQYSGIQATTAISAPASTWQIDFTTRLLQIDERERLSNLDIYGHEAFFSGGFDVTLNSGTVFNVSAGVAYVGGIRCELAIADTFDVGALPNSIWIDASLQGDLTGKDAVMELVASNSVLTDYTDGNGIAHYVAKICDITGGSLVTDTKVITNLVNDHEGKADPHPQYLRKADVVSQVEAEAGSATTARAWTALRVKQAILKLVKVATETVSGTAEIATQAETNAGTDDARFVTPKKMRFGFSILLATNGYVVFPTWLGGLIIQWGRFVGAGIANHYNYTVNYPITFPNSLYSLSTQWIRASAIGGTLEVLVFKNTLTTSKFDFNLDSSTNEYGEDSDVMWWAIGY